MIEVICGPMFSGKTEELIRRVKRVALAEQRYVVVKPNIKSRNKNEESGISTHDESNAIHAISISESELVETTKDFNVVAIDEVQFFDEDIYIQIQALSDAGKRIIISGLDMDFSRTPFKAMSNLLCIADKVLKLKSVCMSCKENASYSKRIAKSDKLVSIGGKESYQALCKKCYKKEDKQ